MKKIIVSIIVIGLLSITAPISICGEEAVVEPLSDQGEQLQFVTNQDFSLLPEYVPGELIVKFKDETSICMSMSQEDIMTTGIESVDLLNIVYDVSSAEKLVEGDSVPSLSNIYLFTLTDDADVFSAVDEYNNDLSIEYAEPNYILHSFALPHISKESACTYQSDPNIIPNDPFFGEQWAHEKLQSSKAWNIETGNDDVVIAIVDSGVDYTHPDLADNIWINEAEDLNGNGRFDNWPWWQQKNGVYGDLDMKDNDRNGFINDVVGWNFAYRNNDPKDVLGHGTCCAGIAAAVTNNGVGIAGVSWTSKIMSVRSSKDSIEIGDVDLGITTLFKISKSILYAVHNGADIISMSLGFSGMNSLRPGMESLLKQIIDYAYNNGVVLVAAAGNDGSDSDRVHPAAYDNVIAVAATDENDTRCVFSNYGSWVDVAAPGEPSIYSTMPTYHVTMNDPPWSWSENYTAFMGGTSAACPYVAGLVGLLLSKNPEFTQEEIITILHSTTDPVNSKEYIGTGRINAFNAIQIDSVPVAILDSSMDQADVKGVVEVMGKATGDTFKEYILECGEGVYPNSWTEITNSQSPKDGILALWDTTQYSEGLNTVRLRVIDNFDKIFEDRALVFVNNFDDTFYVDDDNTEGPWYGTEEHPYQRINDTFLKAGDRDIVYVFEGRYNEPILIERAINLIGENKDTTIIEGDMAVISIETSDVKVNKFTVMDGPVMMLRSFNSIIENLITSNIRVTLSSQNTIKNNIILGESNGNPHDIGIALGPLSNKNNIVGNIITGKTIGIELHISARNNLRENFVSNNVIGILLTSSSKNIIYENNITSNDFGINVTDSSKNNKIYYNNFYDNSQNAYDESDNTWYKFKLFGKSMGNYWDDYTGEDNNDDGIGDTPYDIPGKTPPNQDKYPLINEYSGSQSNPQSSPQSNPSSQPSSQQYASSFSSQQSSPINN